MTQRALSIFATVLFFVSSFQALATDTGRIDKGDGNTQQIPLTIPDNAPSLIGDYGREGTGSHTGEGAILAIYVSRPPEKEVIAAADGVVFMVVPRAIYISHSSPAGLITGYAPLNGEHLVKVGDEVKRGQPISYTDIGKSPDHYWQHKLTFYVMLNDLKNKQNPHEYWLDGPGKITCFDPRKKQDGSGKSFLTYPGNCTETPRFDPNSVTEMALVNKPDESVGDSNASGSFHAQVTIKCRKTINTSISGKIGSGTLVASWHGSGDHSLEIDDDGSFAKKVGTTPSGKLDKLLKGNVRQSEVEIGMYYVRPGSDTPICFGKNIAELK